MNKSEHGIISAIWRGIKLTNKDELKVLRALDAHYDDTWSFGFVSFRTVCKRTKLPRAVVRRYCRSLARKGMAEYANGLFTEDGEMAGAGYSATRAGHVALQILKGGKQ